MLLKVKINSQWGRLRDKNKLLVMLMTQRANTNSRDKTISQEKSKGHRGCSQEENGKAVEACAKLLSVPYN